MRAEELAVQFDELSEETAVPDDTAFIFHGTNYYLYQGQSWPPVLKGKQRKAPKVKTGFLLCKNK